MRTAVYAYSDIFPPDAPVPTVEAETQRWTTWLRDDSLRVFVGNDGALAGVVLSGPDPSDGSLGHLSRLYVDPARWGQGIGRALYDACLDHLGSQGHEVATLWVLERNARVRAWYERLGWQLTGERKPVYEPAGIDDVRYHLRLG